MKKTVTTFVVQMRPDQAEGLARLLSRLSPEDMSKLILPAEDSGPMVSGLLAMRANLAEAGFHGDMPGI